MRRREGQLVFSGTGSLSVEASGKSGIVSDDYLHIMEGTITVNTTTSAIVNGSETLKPACLKANDYIKVTGGTLHLSSSGTGAKGISCDGYGIFRGGIVNVTVTGSNYGSSGSGGGFHGGGQSSSDGVSAKGIKFDGNLSITGGSLIVKATAHEGIESKGSITISGAASMPTATAISKTAWCMPLAQVRQKWLSMPTLKVVTNFTWKEARSSPSADWKADHR